VSRRSLKIHSNEATGSAFLTIPLSVLSVLQLWDVLQDENLYQNFAGIILSPPPCDDPQVHLARSYRALQVLLKDLDVTSKGMPRQNVLVTETQAGLLTKQVLNSLDKPNGVLIHKRCLLDALLDAYPDKVISSASAGGQDGLEAHLRPLMNPITCHQTLPTLTMLVIYGCTGKKGQASAERTAQVAHMERYTNKPQVKEGHRRKFIKVLSDWGFLSKLAQCIVEEAETETSIGLGEEACESILTIVEVIGYPDAMEAETDERELVDESKLLSPLGQGDWWDPLMSIVASQNSINDASRIAAARTIVGIFGLATGHSTRVLSARAPIADATEKMEGVDSSKVEKEVDSHAPKDNKLREWGLATKIHFSLVSHVPELLKALSIPKSDDDAKTTVYIHRGEDPEEAPESAVPHPGRCRIVPFTSWRLQVVTLLAELLSFVDDDDDEGKKSPRVVAMDAFMKLPLPPSFEGDRGTAIDKNNGCALNPWPTLCEWVFAYPENSLYHVQFLRLFRSICLEHHEATLRLVLQKAKFVARAIRSCSGPLKGITMDCMNILRLRCESLPPRAFLRHFLESHDLWKNFRENLER
jgi:hypothetical protein